MLDQRRIHLLALGAALAALATTAARALPFVGTGWSSPLDVLAVSVLAEPEVLVLVAFAAVVVATIPVSTPSPAGWTRAAVVTATVVQVVAALWTLWRTLSARDVDDGVFLVPSPTARASVYLLLGSLLLVAVAAGRVGVHRSPSSRAVTSQ